MELQQYQNLYQYLQSQQLPPNLTTQQKRKFINFSKNFIIKNNFIYKIDKRQQNNLLRVIRNYEAEPVLFMMHNDPTAGHFATDIMFEKIRSRYIVVAIDYLTKWPEAKALSEATAENVATFIYENIICQHGCPSRILSDRGSHFNNKMIDMERFNRTLCEA
ncbi:DDE-type integrase/transposase/recombinase [Rhizophagus irregularis DAOM 181602=DAOM 197198]|nr:DDE-type integrase/transposase/recombinase [Rhizophagus irregularis DAOM 181602=DAOM 197198]